MEVRAQVARNFSGDSAREKELRTRSRSLPGTVVSGSATYSRPSGWRGASPGASARLSRPGRSGSGAGQTRGKSLCPRLRDRAALKLSLCLQLPAGAEG